jgi:hypothetical protein
MVSAEWVHTESMILPDLLKSLLGLLHMIYRLGEGGGGRRRR